MSVQCARTTGTWHARMHQPRSNLQRCTFCGFGRVDFPVQQVAFISRSRPWHSEKAKFGVRADSSVPLSPGDLQSVSSKEKKLSGLWKRVLAGCALALGGSVIIVQGGLLYFLFMEFFVYQSIREYFGFVSLVGIKEGHAPPPPWGTAMVTICCMSLPLYTFVTGGKIAVALALSAFTMCSVFVTTTNNPRMSTLSSAIFGLLYCGYLPAYWIKLRLMSVPVIQSTVSQYWPVLAGGLGHVTVGFVATMMSIACVVAADVGAFFVGRTFGRTPLTKVSPKKTVEGALGGLAASCAAAVLLQSVCNWPLSLFGALGLGVVVSLASVLGDLIESVMKRDAGLKDSGSLIPGHGGILDRFDSYIFTGAIVYFYIKCLPFFGV